VKHLAIRKEHTAVRYAKYFLFFSIMLFKETLVSKEEFDMTILKRRSPIAGGIRPAIQNQQHIETAKNISICPVSRSRSNLLISLA